MFQFLPKEVNDSVISSLTASHRCIAASLTTCKENNYRYHYSIFYLKISKANDESCPISRKTVQIVDECPDSLEKWIKAAMMKNCTAFATQCSKPSKLQYHCVINSFVNETIEVCAYPKNIVLGRYFYRFIIF